MPTSNLAIWPAIVTLIDAVHPKSVLDVGPGYGKGGTLVREYCRSVETIDAVEAWEDYVTARMICIYDQVFHDDVCRWPTERLGDYDLVLMSEVIEHLEKPDGLDLLDRIPGYVVITTPMEFFDNGPNLPPTETHRSLWSIGDFGDRVEADASMLGGVVVRLARR